jgi:hypothetical protein
MNFTSIIGAFANFFRTNSAAIFANPDAGSNFENISKSLMRNQSCLATVLGGVEHCCTRVAREIGRREVVMMFIWLVPVGIIALFLLYIFGRFRA